jgi:hypothetical protein
MRAVTPDRQLEVCQRPEECYFGNLPSLAMLNSCYGSGSAEAWLLPEIVEACMFCGLKVQPEEWQLLKLVRIIVALFGFLKVDEIQLFFFRFCSGRYMRFHNSFDPSVIIRSLRVFLNERNRAHEEKEMREHERELEERQKNAVTYEEYLRLYNGR